MTSIRTILLFILTAFGTSGCVVAGGGLEDTVDESMVTNSVTPSVPAENADQASDQTTLRNAVSAADLSAARTQPVAWANSDTGATGVITAIEEVRSGDSVCRSFRTSRQRFDGVALYDGQACTRGRGEWTLTRFSEGE